MIRLRFKPILIFAIVTAVLVGPYVWLAIANIVDTGATPVRPGSQSQTRPVLGMVTRSNHQVTYTGYTRDYINYWMRHYIAYPNGTIFYDTGWYGPGTATLQQDVPNPLSFYQSISASPLNIHSWDPTGYYTHGAQTYASFYTGSGQFVNSGQSTSAVSFYVY